MADPEGDPEGRDSNEGQFDEDIIELVVYRLGLPFHSLLFVRIVFVKNVVEHVRHNGSEEGVEDRK